MQPQSNEIEFLGTDPMTGVQTTMQTSPAALRDALINNPALLVGALREVLTQRYDPTRRPPPRPVTLETNITELIAPREAALLSANARKLNRGQLMAMAGWGGQPKLEPTSLGLTVDDIKTIREIFGRQLSTDIATQELELEWSLSCCSCTPCCCCAVSGTRQTRLVA
jgi:hypothetical protein